MDYKITNKAIEKLKYDLVREGLLDYNQLIEAIELSRAEQTNLGQILIQNNIIQEEDLLNFLEKRLHIPYVNLDDYTIDTSTVDLINKEEAVKYKIIPLFKIEETVSIAMADPLDLFVLNNLDISRNYKLEPVICSERSIFKAIKTFYSDVSERVSNSTIPKIPDIKSSAHQFNWQSELNEDKVDDVNVYRLVKAIIYQAIHEKASDIHLDPHKDKLLVRFRIDGLLYNRGSLPILLAPNCISRIKSAAGLDLTEEQIPQHGRMEIDTDKDTINARVSTYPVNYGEKITIKIFSRAPELDLLGFEPDQLEIFKHALHKNNGLIIAAGPLSSGQTTTIYSALEYINSEHKNIMTIESPIRYNIDKINQSQINTSKNFNLEIAIKNLLLQEPDIIYINEITSHSELELVIKSALTGQLVITSLISDGAVGVFYKLLEHKLDPRLISSLVNLVFNQKLLRKLCNNCKTEHKPDPKVMEKFKLPEDAIYFKPKGCKHCNNTGYKGRIGIFEVISVNNTNADQICKSISNYKLQEYLKVNNHKSLLDAAITKVKNGITCIDEVKRILKV